MSGWSKRLGVRGRHKHLAEDIIDEETREPENLGGEGGTLARVLAAGRDTGGMTDSTPAIVSVANDAVGDGLDANVSTTATATLFSAAYADRTATATVQDAFARTIATCAGIEDAVATTTATASQGEADATIRAEVTHANGGNAVADSIAESAGLQADAKNQATTNGDGDADASSIAVANGNGDARMWAEADAWGTGLAEAAVVAISSAGQAGMTAEADSTSARIAFFNATPIPRPTGVAVTAADIHAALVSLGLIEA